MLPEPWNGDNSLIWPDVEAAWSDPVMERAVLRWLQRRAPREWAHLDAVQRSWSLHSGPPRGLASTLAEGWRSFASSGYAREAAVRALAEDPDPVAIGFLLLRCADWVEPVRERARAAVLARAEAGTIDGHVWFPLLLATNARLRGTGILEACLSRVAPEPEALLSHPDRGARRWALARIQARSLSPDALRGLILSVSDAAVARALARTLAGAADDALLRQLLGDRKLALRRAAWEQVLAGRLPGAALDEASLSAGLLSSTRGVRVLAQRVARARGLDAAALYREAPGDTASQRRRRLVGQGEWGAPEAVALAREALSDPDLSVRVSAITVLGQRLDPPAPLLLQLLRQVSGPELRAVRRALITRRVWVAEHDLAALRRGSPEHRRCAWLLGRARGRWERLLASLRASLDPEPTLADAARQDLLDWCRLIAPRAGRPSEALRPAIEDALRAAPNATVAFLLRD